MTMQLDFSMYKFRCSGLVHLMTKSKTKDPLSDGTKTYLRDIYIKEMYGRSKPEIDNKYTKKGKIVESDTLDLIKEVTGRTHFKNSTELDNDFIKGTPDVITKDDLVIDAKSCFDIWTFAAKDHKKIAKDYYYQILGYMWLTGKNNGQICCGLVNTPEEIIVKELYKISWSIPELASNGQEAEVKEQEIRRNYIYDDIPAVERLKCFDFARNQEDIDALKDKVRLAREYLNTLTL